MWLLQWGPAAKVSEIAVVKLKSYEQFSEIFIDQKAANEAHEYMLMNGFEYWDATLFSRRKLSKIACNFLFRLR